MMKRLLSLVLLCSLAGAAFAQMDSEKAAYMDAFSAKVNRLDAYNMILPLTLSKEQLRKILPVVEKARQRVRETQKVEYAEVKKLELEVDAALAKAGDKQAVPSRDLLNKIYKTRVTLQQTRAVMASLNTDEVFDAMKKNMNAGQLTVAAKSLNPRDFDSSLKAEEMKQDDRIRIFAREIMLMPEAYDVLVKLSMGG